jgi:predicted nucleic acid-binding Zn ribbon protein
MKMASCVYCDKPMPKNQGTVCAECKAKMGKKRG